MFVILSFVLQKKNNISFSENRFSYISFLFFPIHSYFGSIDNLIVYRAYSGCFCLS